MMVRKGATAKVMELATTTSPRRYWLRRDEI